MDLTDISIQPADPQRHFDAIAALISSQETEPSTQQTLLEWYNKQLDDGIQFTATVSPLGEVLGFNGIYRDNSNLECHYGLYLIVDQVFRGQGLASLLYDNLLSHATYFKWRTLIIRVRDTCVEGIRFDTQRGFVEKKHSIEMMFDLKTWDESPYEPVLHVLQAQGFRFTNRAELGDTPEARRRLYALNNGASATDPGSDGIPPWATFKEFEKDICTSYWYRPDGQIVAIDTISGEWAAMSAITVFEGVDHAYNLFTGTDVGYRGRKLAQAVKSLALRNARTFEVDPVRTSHNSENAAMIAIDTKLGYVHTPGTLIMVKELGHA
jgi:RimJ/RimL family protein N-acetyltransferase